MAPRRLNTDAVVAAAAELADSEGLDALTISRLAQQLGIKAPSLYNHIGGSAELLTRLRIGAYQLLRDRLALALAGRSGPDAVRGAALALRGVALEHPGQYEAILRSPAEHETEEREARDESLRVALAAFSSYGLSERETLHAARFVRSAVHGFIAIEAAGGFGVPVAIDESFERLIDAIVVALESWPDQAGDGDNHQQEDRP